MEGLTHIERLDDGTVIQYGALVAKYISERPVMPEKLHGNDLRMKDRRAAVHASLRSVCGT